MTEANKKSFKVVGAIFGGIILWTLFATYVPDGSIAKKIVSGLVILVLIYCTIMYTGLGNPIKKLYRKLSGIKEE